MRLEEFFAGSAMGPIRDEWCKATCGECQTETTFDQAPREELDADLMTIYRCPKCSSPLLRINLSTRSLMIYGEKMSIDTPKQP